MVQQGCEGSRGVWGYTGGGVAIAVSPIFSILIFSSSPTNRLREEIRKEKNEKMEEVEKGNKEEKPTCRVIMHRWMLASIDLAVDAGVD